jgi:uncharacterized membrane protein YciS (DUF1049 family)
MNNFLNLLYAPSWTSPMTISIIWLSLDISKNNSKYNYFIFKLNYHISFLLPSSFPINFPLIITSILITTSFLFHTRQYGYAKID